MMWSSGSRAKEKERGKRVNSYRTRIEKEKEGDKGGQSGKGQRGGGSARLERPITIGLRRARVRGHRAGTIGPCPPAQPPPQETEALKNTAGRG